MDYFAVEEHVRDHPVERDIQASWIQASHGPEAGNASKGGGL